MNEGGSNAGGCGGESHTDCGGSPVDSFGPWHGGGADTGTGRLVGGTSPATRRAADRLRALPPPAPWIPDDYRELENNVRSHYRMVRLMAFIRWLAITLLALAVCMAVAGAIR